MRECGPALASGSSHRWQMPESVMSRRCRCRDGWGRTLLPPQRPRRLRSRPETRPDAIDDGYHHVGTRKPLLSNTTGNLDCTRLPHRLSHVKLPLLDYSRFYFETGGCVLTRKHRTLFVAAVMALATATMFARQSA